MGASATFGITLVNSRRTVRHGIGLAVLDSTHADHWAWTDVPAQGNAQVQIAFSPAQRGLHPVPLLTAETRYPLGTFRVWALWRPAAQVLVYPAPEPGAPPLPPGEPRSGGTGSAPSHGRTEFDGVRAYRRGDPMKLVVWKKAAQAFASGNGTLIARDAQQPHRHELWLDHAHTGLGDLETRLSRLTAWVLQADRLGLDYGLRLPGQEIAVGHGAAQRRVEQGGKPAAMHGAHGVEVLRAGRALKNGHAFGHFVDESPYIVGELPSLLLSCLVDHRLRRRRPC